MKIKAPLVGVFVFMLLGLGRDSTGNRERSEPDHRIAQCSELKMCLHIFTNKRRSQLAGDNPASYLSNLLNVDNKS